MPLSIRGIPIQRHFKMKRLAFRNRFLRPSYQSSFFRSQDYRRRYWSELVKEKGLENEIYPEFSKTRGRKLAESVDIATPRLLAGPVSPADLRLDDYGDAFVIKPDWGTSTRGVLVLEKTGKDKYFELINGVSLNGKMVQGEAERRMSRTGRGRSDQLIVEESVADGTARPDEWKIFSFYGEIGIVQQINRNGDRPTMHWYDNNGEDLGKVRTDVKHSPSLKRPTNFSGLVEAAKTLSLALPTGFVRVDLFERATGQILFGELCLIPGGDIFFRKGWDRRLGKMWDEANTRLLSERKPLIP